ncbi:MAG: DUF5333 domain-containing protein [Pseudomonadota bacterium]
MKYVIATALALGLALPAGGARADLSEEADINNALLVLAVADKIRRECSSIGGRLGRAQSLAGSARSLARERGYSEAEIDTYINSSANKAAMRERRNAYFQSKGASNLDPASLCVLGNSEIASGSQIGRLLRAR